MKRYLGISVLTAGLLVIFALAVAACAPEQSEPTQAQPTQAATGPDAAALLQDRCSVCHSLDQVTAERNTKDAWERTVTTMIGKGARLTDEEKAILVDFLAANYGG